VQGREFAVLVITISENAKLTDARSTLVKLG